MFSTKNMLEEMTTDFEKNIKIIKKTYSNLNYQDNAGQSLLHIFVDNLYDENKCFLAIQSLLKAGLSPNLQDEFDYIFIQTALYTGYSEGFILKIIDEACKYGLNINHVDSDEDTIMHTTIYSDDYTGNITNIFKLLVTNGFDVKKLDHEGKNLVEAMIYQHQTEKQYTLEEVEDFKKLFLEYISKNKETNSSTKQVFYKENKGVNTLTQEEIENLEKFGIILNKKQYFSSPTIGREIELKNIMISLAQEKKTPLLVGESGVGKTAIIDELAFRMQNQQVPTFLKNQIILEITPMDI